MKKKPLQFMLKWKGKNILVSVAVPCVFAEIPKGVYFSVLGKLQLYHYHVANLKILRNKIDTDKKIKQKVMNSKPNSQPILYSVFNLVDCKSLKSR